MPDCGTLPSKIGGQPAWAQDVIELPEHHFALQLYESDLLEWSPPHVGIFGGGNAFFFLKSPLREGDRGAFFIQFT